MSVPLEDWFELTFSVGFIFVLFFVCTKIITEIFGMPVVWDIIITEEPSPLPLPLVETVVPHAVYEAKETVLLVLTDPAPYADTWCFAMLFPIALVAWGCLCLARPRSTANYDGNALPPIVVNGKLAQLSYEKCADKV